ncbi:hypothetical protein GKZ90_0024305 [Flavobacterium sp. MC2016-06]|uniref:hypothetical protein n=1 Tax=Flavobacterium sp. MC2016-06 TaxID=2676308 RepID=UPI0012BA7FAD|nr:hypothetical protein [Flavobacterium sp. MC2016-06]MBU3861877.1 hypothetical protein [Flavobacterium sp. MC2016-06]
MFNPSKIKEYSQKKRLEKVISLSKDYYNFEKGDNIFYLKTRIETKGNGSLSELKLIINSQKNITLSLKRNQEPYDFSLLDKDGIIKSSYQYYDIYLLIKQNKYYYLIIQENQFLKNNKDCEVAHFEEVSPFKHKIIHFNSLKLI